MAVRSDICLILEGTYPYVAGGVSSWVHQLLNAFSELRFSLLVLLPTDDYGAEAKYQLPKNVTEIVHVSIHDYEVPEEKSGGNVREGFEIIRRFVERALEQDFSLFPELVETIVGEEASIRTRDMLFSEESWELLCSFYEARELDVSFIDFFWTFRFSILAILRALNARIPQAKIYHSISTGYAGVLGAVATIKKPDAAYLITEHGIYAKERKIEIADARWIYDETEGSARPKAHQSIFKQWWISMFRMMSQISYQYADEIVTLYEGNRKYQIMDGADPDKCKVIPNGIEMNRFTLQKEAIPPCQKEKIIISLVGRVVPIKDVKTFISACKIICQENPKIECWICGPTEEDPEYYGDCLVLRNLLGLEDKIIFKGKLDLAEFYPQMDVVVLTSI
ncbi:MAG: GT4 family glycosyltransferase PelF, partial [Planctomycetota bacterium]|nr:GT4 family glycosyltransferase PelF [Planctomycetota bacterium]